MSDDEDLFDHYINPAIELLRYDEAWSDARIAIFFRRKAKELDAPHPNTPIPERIKHEKKAAEISVPKPAPVPGITEGILERLKRLQ